MIRVRAPPLCLALAVLALLAASVAGQMPPGQFGGSRPTFTAVKTDIPYIKCGVCETLAKNAYRQVKTARDALRPGKKVWPCIRPFQPATVSYPSVGRVNNQRTT